PPSLTFQATDTITPTQIVETPASAMKLTLIYDDQQITVLNMNDHPLDLSSLRFVQHGSDERHFEAILWRSPQASNPISSLKSQSCFQVVTKSNTNLPDPSKPCLIR